MFNIISKKLQIFKPIVLFIFVRTNRIFNASMMYNFFRSKVSSEMFLHHKSMLHNITSLTGKRMIGIMNKNISFRGYCYSSFKTIPITHFTFAHIPFPFFREWRTFFTFIPRNPTNTNFVSFIELSKFITHINLQKLKGSFRELTKLRIVPTLLTALSLHKKIAVSLANFIILNNMNLSRGGL